MVTYDENGHCINQFLKKYNDLKSAFSEFKKSINAELSANDQLKILIKNETEIDMTLEFIDRDFLIEFSIIKIDERNFLGTVIFSEIQQNRDAEKIKIDQTYFDDHGNVKESPSARYSDINLKKSESSMYLLKYWIAKFIEKNIEKV